MTSRGAVRALVLAVAAVTAAGCGQAGPFDYVPVSGHVVFEDGTPLAVGRVIFQPLAEPVDGAHPRAGAADLDSSGNFSSATSYKPGDGLVPGQHKVAIMFAVDEDGRALVSKEFTRMTTTPLVVDTDDSPFTITVSRP